MEVIFTLFLLWVFVTLIGHGSFLLIRAMFRAAINDQYSQGPAKPGQSDIAATRRVLLELAERDLLTSEETEKLHCSLVELTKPAGPIPILAAPVSVATEPETPAASVIGSTKSAASTVGSAEPAVSATITEIGAASAVGSVDEPILADLVVEEQAQPTVPVISKAEVIRSFLAANNIRWGELVAGMLIVICSIGLVISLWNTITEHRFTPSIIFLSANAAIYAAGFYTLSRWRLRHTSRAVLAIATLLVPLTVLAGIAAAGNGTVAVQLTDPLTLLAIGLAAAVYGFLLFRGGNALARRPYALPIALSVAGPVASLPLIPAAIRNFEPQAGWFVGIGSIAVVAALSLTVRMRRSTAQKLGTVGGRSRMLVIAFAAFAMSITVGYAGFAMHEFGQPALMAIALATIPAVVALAAAGRSLAAEARNSSHAMVGSVLCALLLGLAWLVLPPATSSVGWLWSWGLVLTVSLAAATWLFREPRWLALATLPVGIAATVSSPVWLGNQIWQEIGFWNHCVAGEPMLAAAMVSLVTAIGCAPAPQGVMRRWLGYAAVVWASVSLVIAMILSVAAESFVGTVPPWTVTAVLLVGTLVFIALAKRHQNFSIATVVTTTFAALSFFRPLEWNAGWEFAPPLIWIHTSLATSATLLVLGELADQLGRIKSIDLTGDDRWNASACLAGAIATVIACVIASQQWISSATMLALACGLLFWSAIRSRSIIPMFVCQTATVALAVVIGYGRHHDILFASDSWQTGSATFAWAICAACVAAVWLGVRQIATLNMFSKSSRLLHLKPGSVSIDQSPIGIVSIFGSALLAIGAAWSFAALLAGGLGSNAVMYSASWQLPCVGFLATALTIGWMRWQESRSSDSSKNDFSGALAAVTTIGFVIWSVSHAASQLPLDPQARLVVATTLASIIFLIANRSTAAAARIVWLAQSQHVFAALAAIMIALSSIALITNDWIDPVARGDLADRFSTLSVAMWWLLGSAGLFLQTKQSPRTAYALVSSLLAPAAAILVVPAFYQVTPIVWFQVAALASATWFALAYWLMNRRQLDGAELAIDFSRSFMLIIGIGSAAFAVLHILFDVQSLQSTLSLSGALISLIAVAYWCVTGLQTSGSSDTSRFRLPIQSGVALLAGQIGWLAADIGVVTGIQVVELTAGIWLATSIASLVRHDQNRFATVHVTAVSISLLVVDWLVGTPSELIPWLALAGLSTSGCLVGFAAWARDRSIIGRLADRVLGWFVIIAGGYLLTARMGLPNGAELVWTICIAWTGLWILLWRTLAFANTDTDPNVDIGKRFGSVPDIEFAILLGFAAVCEAIFATVFGNDGYPTSLNDPLMIARLMTWGLVASSAIYRSDRLIVWNASLTTLLSIVSLVSVQLAIGYGATPGQRFASALLPAGFTIAFLAQWVGPLARSLSKLSVQSADAISSKLADSVWMSAMVVAAMATIASAAMIVNQTAPAEIHMTIVAVALSAWAVAAIADTSNRQFLRHVAVTLALATIGLWASVSPVDANHPFLMTLMRWLVAAVFTIPMLLFILPNMIGTELANRWRGAFRQGALVASTVATVSLVGMLVQEALIRSASGIDDISPSLVIGVAVTLAILSGLAGLAAIASSPTSSWRERLNLTDAQRIGLTYAAQAIGAITWLHIFLCKTDWAFIGLRGYWPYIVMGLAFLSVGVTEWSQRRGDQILSQTLKKTALYLPLIPIIGFWFGFSAGEFDWLFERGKVRYDVLLTIGAVYYVAISAIWKEAAPRIAAIVLGNAAWWIVLVQQPGWGFIAHPQAWMIPPAVCVLFAVHVYRQRLDPSVATAIRYSATLLIYISSTADMLLQQIGQNIWGPIILVILALIGMTAGVILRVRPFLFLGATFVFIGVTSMVWHAQAAIGQVWPWWVFGITTGICLLGGLMALEKSKPKLRRYANELSTWQG